MALQKSRVVTFPTTDQQLIGQLFADRLTDPSEPMNQLRRPVYRTCLGCLGCYRSIVSLLCDSGFCSPACEQRFYSGKVQL